MENFAQAQVDLKGAMVGMASHGSDAGLFVEFRMESVADPVKSRDEGRTVHHDVPFITIHFPGDKTKKIDRPAKLIDDLDGPADATRFPRQWAAFKAQEEQVADGLPIGEWPPISKSEANDLKAIGVHTVEQLAAMPDTALSWLGARQMQAKARTWLERAGDAAAEMRLATENAQLREQLAALQGQVREMGAMVEQIRKEGTGGAKGRKHAE